MLAGVKKKRKGIHFPTEGSHGGLKHVITCDRLGHVDFLSTFRIACITAVRSQNLAQAHLR
jgi:hypothetical protein